MPDSTVTSKGQITIPKSIRDYFRLQSGDRVCFRLTADGQNHLAAHGGDA